MTLLLSRSQYARMPKPGPYSSMRYADRRCVASMHYRASCIRRYDLCRQDRSV